MTAGLLATSSGSAYDLHSFAAVVARDGIHRGGDGQGALMRFLTMILALLAVTVAAGCANMPGSDGRYADFDQGRSNFRATLAFPAEPLM